MYICRCGMHKYFSIVCRIHFQGIYIVQFFNTFLLSIVSVMAVVFFVIA